MHSSRSVVRAPRSLPRDKARKSPRRRPGARSVYPARLPRGARSRGHRPSGRRAPPSSHPSKEKPQQESLKRAAGSEEAGIGDRATHPRAADAPQDYGSRHPRRARAPPSPAARSRARPRAAKGEGRPRARPLLRRPNFPQLPQLSCALTVRLPGLPRGPSRSSSAPWRRRRTIGGRSLGGGWGEEQAPRCRPSPNT